MGNSTARTTTLFPLRFALVLRYLTLLAENRFGSVGCTHCMYNVRTYARDSLILCHLLFIFEFDLDVAATSYRRHRRCREIRQI